MCALKIGFLGVDNDDSTFGYQALKKYCEKYYYGIDIEPVAFNTHSEIIERVGKQEVDLGVVAIENTLDGIVAETARAIEKNESHFGLKICGEVIIPIELFYANKSGNISDVKRLISHSSAIGQCGNFVTELYKQGILVEVRPSTGAAAKEAAESGDISVAVLASRSAINNNKLIKLRAESLTNHSSSSTRFMIIGKKYSEKTGKDKSCFLVSLDKERPGSLSKTLAVFAENNVNLSLIYPIPIRAKQWEYTFMLEVEGHISDWQLENAWEMFDSQGIALRSMQFLGSYPNTSAM